MGIDILIADRLSLTIKQVHELIDKLVSFGLVIKEEDYNKDKIISHRYYTTEKGKKTLKKYFDKY